MSLSMFKHPRASSTSNSTASEYNTAAMSSSSPSVPSRSPSSGYRPFVTTFVLFSLLYNLSTVSLLHTLPSTPPASNPLLDAPQNLSIYAYASTLISLLGLYGAVTSTPSSSAYLSLFARFQLVDTILTTVPTLVVLALAAGWHRTICSTEMGQWDGWAHGIFVEDEMSGAGIGECRDVVWAVTGVGAIVVIVIAGVRLLAVGVVRKVVGEMEKREEDEVEQGMGSTISSSSSSSSPSSWVDEKVEPEPVVEEEKQHSAPLIHELA